MTFSILMRKLGKPQHKAFKSYCWKIKFRKNKQHLSKLYKTQKEGVTTLILLNVKEKGTFEKIITLEIKTALPPLSPIFNEDDLNERWL